MRDQTPAESPDHRLLNQANEEDASPADREARRGAVLNLLDSEARLRSKRELIEEFIESYLPANGDAAALKDAFTAYWAERQAADVAAISADEGLEPERFEALLSAYRFSGARPLREDIVGTALKPPGILERRALADRVFRKMQDHLETFEEAIGDI